MAKKKKARKQPSMKAVISGNEMADAHQLIEFIHKINPSGMGYSDAEAQRAYDQKTILQNILVDEYKENLDFQQDENQPNIVSIYFEGRDACHAMLDHLSDDNRAWIRFYLDQQQYTQTQGYVQEKSKKQKKSIKKVEVNQQNIEQKTANELLACAEVALEQYDYPTAQQCYMTAFEQTPRSIETTLAVLHFLVDVYGDNETALSLGNQLSAQDQVPDVHFLLAMAAARMKLTDQAEKWLAMLSRHPKISEVYYVLCHDAVLQQDIKQATYYFEQAVQHSSEQGAEQLQLADQIAILRQQRRKPLEDEITALFDAGSFEAAQLQAQACLDAWPDSSVARKIIREIERQQQLEQIQSLQQQAQSAYQQQQFEHAMQCWHQAIKLGCEPQTLEPLFSITNDKIKQLADEAQLHKTKQLLQASEPTAGLLAYLACDVTLQEKIKKNHSQALLLMQLDAIMHHHKIKPAMAVKAVIALQQALKLADVPQQALALIEPYDKYLSHFVEVSEIKDKVLQAQQDAITKRAQAYLQQAIDAFETNELMTAKQCIDEINLKALTDDEKSKIAQLNQKICQIDIQKHLVNQYQYYNDDNDGQALLAANQILNQLIERTVENEKQHWLNEKNKLIRKIKQQWHIKTIPKPHIAQIGLWITNMSPAVEMCSCLILPNQREILTIQSNAKRLLLTTISLDGNEIYQCVSIRIPETLAYFRTFIKNDQVWIIGDNGYLLSLDINLEIVLSWIDLKKYITNIKDQYIRDIYLSDEGRYCWVEFEANGYSWEINIFDIQKMCIIRTIKVDDAVIIPRLGDKPLYILQPFEKKSITLYHDNGKQYLVCSELDNMMLHSAVSYLNGNQTIILFNTHHDVASEVEDDFYLRVGLLNENYVLTTSYVIVDSNYERPHAMMFDEVQQFIYVLIWDDTRYRVHQLHLLNEALVEVDVWDMPNNTIFLQDNARQTAQLLFWNHGDRFYIEHKLPDDERIVSPNQCIDSVIPENHCINHQSILNIDSDYRQQIYALSKEDVAVWLNNKKELFAKNLDEMIRVLYALYYSRYITLARIELDQLLAQYPNHTELIALKTHSGLYEYDQKTINLFESINLEDVPEQARHICHILGYYYYREADYVKAKKIWQQGENYPGMCQLAQKIDLIALSLASLKPKTWDKNQPWTHQLSGRIIMADEYLKMNQIQQALDILLHPILFQAKEKQSSLRLATALLATDETAYFYEKAMIFCQLIDMYDATNQIIRELDLISNFSIDVTNEIIAQAQRWIEKNL